MPTLPSFRLAELAGLSEHFSAARSRGRQVPHPSQMVLRAMGHRRLRRTAAREGLNAELAELEHGQSADKLAAGVGGGTTVDRGAPLVELEAR